MQAIPKWVTSSLDQVSRKGRDYQDADEYVAELRRVAGEAGYNLRVKVEQSDGDGGEMVVFRALRKTVRVDWGTRGWNNQSALGPRKPKEKEGYKGAKVIDDHCVSCGIIVLDGRLACRDCRE